MRILASLADKIAGGFAGTVFDAVKAYFPPDMSPEQQAAVKLEIEKIELKKQAQYNEAMAKAEASINDRISQQEGTARDLMSLPFVGRVIIFARGCQRPTWGFATMWADLQWLSGEWGKLSERQESALWFINLLVLGFLFGERAVKNLTPLIAQHFTKK